MLTRFAHATAAAATAAALATSLLMPAHAADALLSRSDPSASAGPDAVTSAKLATGKPKLQVTSPTTAVEGNRYAVTVKVGGVKKYVQRVELQHQSEDIYGDPIWEPAKKVRGARGFSYRALAGEDDLDRYRAVAVMKKGRPTASRPSTVKVWHWSALSVLRPYYATQGVNAYSFNQFSMNGSAYAGGWYTNGSYRFWETRYTLGRKCSDMRGTFGVTDSSADGSTAVIRVLSEGTTTAYTSPTLLPGAVIKKSFKINNAYRVSIIAEDITDTETLGDITSYPAIGDVQVLCHGLE